MEPTRLEKLNMLKETVEDSWMWNNSMTREKREMLETFLDEEIAKEMSNA